MFIVTAVKSPSFPHLVDDPEQRMGPNWLMQNVLLLYRLTLQRYGKESLHLPGHHVTGDVLRDAIKGTLCIK